METIKWSDQLGHRSRAAGLLIIANGTIRRFAGETIPGVVAVVASHFRKDGKWSHTTYEIAPAAGVRLLPYHSGWETGTLLEGLSSACHQQIRTWAEFANALGVTIPTARAALTADGWTKGNAAAEALDKVDADLAAIDDASPSGVADLAISFGAPTRRLMDAGFWDWPVEVVDASGAVIDRLVGEGYASTMGAVRVLSVEKSSGHHGGYVSIRVAAPCGAVLKHEAPSAEPAESVDQAAGDPVAGDPCPRCGERLMAYSPSGRGTAACDRCQRVWGEVES